ncbi:hypothetical protein JAAARDRAFT_188375 [Jaapia argillacea MUCL 33604]|uniref:Rab proteins geranylgeranyltransferase n=1 Tax=Jaapia argillacea MUCL 33604 TaxID=933084 RepID=A0A067QDU9_9AGAM|nr:hypothetical protein JAAARDRAFT_188375 [Jaapia argillacea MUCL 33604]
MASHYDVIVIGTGLTESITAAALSKAGFTVAHIDENLYYGGDEASLDLDDLDQWAKKRSAASDKPLSSPYLQAQAEKFVSISAVASPPPHSRQYSVSLLPSLIPSTGPFIASLIASGVSRYGGYKLLERVAIYHSAGLVKNVPGSKEDVFKSKDLSLVEKRRLMRFLLFAAGDFAGSKELQGHEDAPFIDFLRTTFSLSMDVATAITYALAFCSAASDPTLPALTRIHHYLRSSGRYGNSPFLVGHYGGAGEIVQGFCRVSAVVGGVCILARNILSIKQSPPPEGHPQPTYVVELEGFDEPLTSRLIISAPDYTPFLSNGTSQDNTHSSPPPFSSRRVARGVIVIDHPIYFPFLAPPSSDSDPIVGASVSTESMITPVDTAVLVFPPSFLPDGSSTTAAHAFITGAGSMSAPVGIVNISLPLDGAGSSPPDAKAILTPYVNATMALTKRPSSGDVVSDPIFTLFYIQNQLLPSNSENEVTPPLPDLETCFTTPPISPTLSECADSAAMNAEKLFWKAVNALKGHPTHTPGQGEEIPEGQDLVEIESFWPPLETIVDDEGDESW